MAAQTTQSIRDDVTTYNKKGVMADVDALAEKVKHEQAKAEVAVEMSGEGSEKRLAAIEASLKSGPSADEEIEALLGGAKKPAASKKSV
jgi:phage shock protein A